MPSTLYRNGVIHSPADPFAEAVLVADGQVAWLGSEETVHTVLDGVDEVVDLDGALVTPGFVDAHAHVLETGFALEGIDLSAVAAPTLAAALDSVAAAARAARDAGRTGPLLGHGWDETRWPEGRPPTRGEVDRAAGGAPVYLSRTDVHSAVVSSSFAEGLGLSGAHGWSEDGPVTGDAHHRAREAARDVPPERREALYRSGLVAAAAAGIVSLHEHSAPFIDTRDGLRRLLRLTADAAGGLPGVVGYRAELCRTPEEVRELHDAVPGLTGVGGDLTVDGSIGSRTAALRVPYADGGGAGRVSLSAQDVAAHVLAVARAGSQAAFHVIGDRAMAEVLQGFAAAADARDVPPGATTGHRIEHAEMVDADALALLVRLGLTASVQPAFDAAWGGADGMYAQRLGPTRAATLNPFAALAAAGVPLAFGSDSPVTPFDPWGAVAAAVHHHQPGHRISARAAFRAHTRGGWRAARDRSGGGEIRLGAPASLAVWRVGELSVQTPDDRLAAWSTDPRAGTPLLPALGPDHAAPVCLRTLRDGVTIFDAMG
ncbi:MAG: Amidohydrolase 3 [Actinotalea sp.]|nr:Amidohydrolase 3 [Actinotalea sp.]